eukprot:Platyproteum_vivax@DN17284_c0_g1_i1.p1
MVVRLKYRILRCSSEDEEYPATELLIHSSQTRGWCSARFCDFPQEIILQFESECLLKQMQFLAHQSKIPTKIELFTANPGFQHIENRGLEGVKWSRLGYLSLASNEQSGFQ